MFCHPFVLQNFLLDQKDGGLHPEVSRLKREEKAGGLKVGTLTSRIADNWDRDNVVEMSSSRLMMTDEVVEHYWEGNPKTPIYCEDRTRDLAAEAALPDPPPLERPRKFLIYVQYKLHRTLLKKVRCTATLKALARLTHETILYRSCRSVAGAWSSMTGRCPSLSVPRRLPSSKATTSAGSC